ncbi:MAG: hypothetical protein OXG19_05585 [Chloroflexi bacterium]|nr:hypothetical protein [Chloroflexota bacterium]
MSPSPPITDPINLPPEAFIDVLAPFLGCVAGGITALETIDRQRFLDGFSEALDRAKAGSPTTPPLTRDQTNKLVALQAMVEVWASVELNIDNLIRHWEENGFPPGLLDPERIRKWLERQDDPGTSPDPS